MANISNSSSAAASSSGSGNFGSGSVILRPATRVTAKLRGTAYQGVIDRVVKDSVYVRVHLTPPSSNSSSKSEVLTIEEKYLEGGNPRMVGSRVKVVERQLPAAIRQHGGARGRVVAVIDRSAYLVRFAGDGVRKVVKRSAMRCLDAAAEGTSIAETATADDHEDFGDDEAGFDDDEQEEAMDVGEGNFRGEGKEAGPLGKEKVGQVAVVKPETANIRPIVVRAETKEEKQDRYGDLVLGLFKEQLKHILPQVKTDDEEDDDDEDDDAGYEDHLVRLETNLNVGDKVEIIWGNAKVTPWKKRNVFEGQIIGKEQDTTGEGWDGRNTRFKVHINGWLPSTDHWISVEKLYMSRIRPVPYKWVVKQYGPGGGQAAAPPAQNEEEKGKEGAAEKKEEGGSGSGGSGGAGGSNGSSSSSAAGNGNEVKAA